ncbi:hypothetical protein PRIPAC_72720, partial [Pristionchus pacificus]
FRMILRIFPILIVISLSIAEEDLIVNTSYGSIQGYESTSTDGTRVRIFKSVPFASPPIGDLRWKLPVQPKKWEGVKDGKKYSAACMSNSTTSKSPQPWVDEDCLYLNVFIHGECSASNKKCPIVVYYHGGGMNFDSATYFNDTALKDTYASNGVMLVIPAFRLGFTGQFTLGDNEELVPSNLGVHDALHALKYVKKEAAAFGGDTDAITVMGHSFGGGLAIMLAFSPLRKLQVPIHQFIIMSPGFTFDPPETNEKLSKEMVKRAGCSNMSKKLVFSCMKTKSGPELLAIQRTLEEENFPSVGATFGGVLLRAPLFPFDSISDVMNNPPNANILIGSTINEMDTLTNATGRTGALIGAKNVDELDQLYGNLSLSGKINLTHAPQTESLYVSVYLTSKAVMENGFKAFLYSFDQPTHNHHTDDLSYLMGIHYFEKDDNEKEIAKFYPELFLNFTKFGTPSPNWEPTNHRSRHYSIKVDLPSGRMPEMHDFYEKETIDFWVQKAPKIDKMITVTKAAGAKIEWEKITGEFRDLIIEEDSAIGKKNETIVPVVLIHSSYFPSFLMVCAVFLLGIILGRYLLGDSESHEERMWILGPDGRGMRIVSGKAPAYAEQMF